MSIEHVHSGRTYVLSIILYHIIQYKLLQLHNFSCVVSVTPQLRMLLADQTPLANEGRRVRRCILSLQLTTSWWFQPI